MSCHFVRSDEVLGRREHVPGGRARVASSGTRRGPCRRGTALDARDTDILEHAVDDDRVIVAADTDFGELLAVRGTAQPSVGLFHRQTGRRPREQAALLLANVPSVESDLQDGAIVVIEDRRLRVRALPIAEPRDTRRT